MPSYICVTCGVQYAETAEPPAHCMICEEERQYIGAHGQRWTTLEELRATHRNRIADEEPGLIGIGTEPAFAIGQRALLVQSPGGNILWDCNSLIDDATLEAIKTRGGARAMAICHPHFYSSMVEWSRALGNIPIYLHGADKQWVMRPDPCIVYWDGDTHSLGDGLTLIHCGGHFAGSTAMHWAAGAEGKGVLLTGDTLTVVSDRRFVSFMYSYPNLIPLNARKINRIVQSVEPFAFDRIYGGWWERLVSPDAKGAVKRSAERYLRAIQG
jgi:glyoxylase-like metal-dependent hydrolase (beta-lactamase superfamily II)